VICNEEAARFLKEELLSNCSSSWPLRVSEKEEKNVFYYNSAIGHLCKKLQKCHQSFEQCLKLSENIFKLFSI
jgi:hypothetical protein